VLRDARAAAFKHNARKPIDHDAGPGLGAHALH